MTNRLGRALGIDLGSRRIGIALSDPSRSIASPHTVLQRAKTQSEDHAAIRQIMVEQEVTVVVVGLPLSMTGRDGPAAKAARIEIEAMGAAFVGIEVVAFDERLTTISAERSLQEAHLTKAQQRDLVDKVAAAVMLQAFLDSAPK